MSNNDEYLANAAECRRMASMSRQETDKWKWLEMAQYWEARIKTAPTQTNASVSRR
jgi:hypothetical protein